MAGLLAVRLGDRTAKGVAFSGSKNVLINGRQATRQGDLNTFKPGNPMVSGSKSVLINGRPTGRVSSIESRQLAYISGSKNTLFGS